jgi:hypothetical protein
MEIPFQVQGTEVARQTQSQGDSMTGTMTLLFVIKLLSASLQAQSPKIIQRSGSVTFEGPEQDPPSGLQKIYSNLGRGNNAYYANTGFVVTGVGFTEFIAMPFTPTANATVSQVRAAVEYITGTNQVNLSLYSDFGGSPGTLLAGPVTVTALPIYPSCCTLAIANFTASVPVTQGTQYWVVADTPSSGTGSDFQGVWNFVPQEPMSYGLNIGTGWFTELAFLEEPAGAVYGTIP